MLFKLSLVWMFFGTVAKLTLPVSVIPWLTWWVVVAPFVVLCAGVVFFIVFAAILAGLFGGGR